MIPSTGDEWSAAANEMHNKTLPPVEYRVVTLIGAIALAIATSVLYHDRLILIMPFTLMIINVISVAFYIRATSIDTAITVLIYSSMSVISTNIYVISAVFGVMLYHSVDAWVQMRHDSKLHDDAIARARVRFNMWFDGGQLSERNAMKTLCYGRVSGIEFVPRDWNLRPCFVRGMCDVERIDDETIQCRWYANVYTCAFPSNMLLVSEIYVGIGNVEVWNDMVLLFRDDPRTLISGNEPYIHYGTYIAKCSS